MSTESDFGGDTPRPDRGPTAPPQRSTRRPSEGVDPADPAAPGYDKPPADRGGPAGERSPRDPAEGRDDIATPKPSRG
ncbi:MAG: hypothetical protein ACJ8G7_25280 [Rhizobacter sp.]